MVKEDHALVGPHKAAEKLKRFPPSLSFVMQQLLEDEVVESSSTCGAAGREIIACFVTAPTEIRGVSVMYDCRGDRQRGQTLRSCKSF